MVENEEKNINQVQLFLFPREEMLKKSIKNLHEVVQDLQQTRDVIKYVVVGQVCRDDEGTKVSQVQDRDLKRV